MFGIEVWRMYPQEGPFWKRDPGTEDPETGEWRPELFESYEEAVRRADELMGDEYLKDFCFKAKEYKKDEEKIDFPPVISDLERREDCIRNDFYSDNFVDD